jgi:HNH endonuclease
LQFNPPPEFKFVRHRRVKHDDEAALRKGLLWVFRNTIVRVEEAASASRAEIVTRIKHKVLSEENAFAKMARVVDLFEKMEKEPVRRRLPIPDEVRVLVWRRDEGKCVRCGSSERLEFDHIIPVEKGGSSTARNIQLLCETCNRQKGATI